MARGSASSQLFQWKLGLGRTRLSPCCALMAATGLTLALALANTSLSDPLWLGGLYDGADVDELIDSLNDGGSIGTRPLPLLKDVGTRRDLSISRSGWRKGNVELGPSLRAPPIHHSPYLPWSLPTSPAPSVQAPVRSALASPGIPDGKRSTAGTSTVMRSANPSFHRRRGDAPTEACYESNAHLRGQRVWVVGLACGLGIEPRWVSSLHRLTIRACRSARRPRLTWVQRPRACRVASFGCGPSPLTLAGTYGVTVTTIG